MNCHHARKLISPYLDGRLTGREMLALGEHLTACESCGEEARALRQVKALLRGLHAPRPRPEFSRTLSAPGTRFGPRPETRFETRPAARPQRGRRLLSALALSCLTTLAFTTGSREGRLARPYAASPLSPFFGAAPPAAGPASLDAASLDVRRAGFGPPLLAPPVGGRGAGSVFDARPYELPPFGPASAFTADRATLTAYRPR